MIKCTECNKEFQSVYSLAGHKKTHTKMVDGVYINRAARIYPKFNCLVCGIEKEYDPAQQSGKYCSNKCQGIHTRQQSFERLKAGDGNSVILKLFLVETNGYKCECCGISEWNGKDITLQLDHIDGNSDNNRIENGRLLCPNCHSQTETFTGRNKKNTKRNSYLQAYKAEKKQGRNGAR